MEVQSFSNPARGVGSGGRLRRLQNMMKERKARNHIVNVDVASGASDRS